MAHVIITKRFDYRVPNAKSLTVKTFVPGSDPVTVTRAEYDALMEANAAVEYKDKVNRNAD